jgi:hypothetical protein
VLLVGFSDYSPQLFKRLNIQLVLFNFGILSGRLVEIYLHIVDLLHLLCHVRQVSVDTGNLFVVFIFGSLVSIFLELVKSDLDFVKVLLEHLFFHDNFVLDLVSVLSQSTLFLLNVAVNTEDLVVSLCHRLSLLFEELQAGIVIKETKPFHEVSVLIQYLLTLEKLEILEFFL